MGFEIIPAIDLRGGRCVRLTQGDFARETVFSDDPAGVAADWTAAGAGTIHVVDLDGAAAGHPINLDALRAIRAATTARIQYGGGLRDDGAVEAALQAGADRVVLGTALVNDPNWVDALCRRMPDGVVVGIDARDGLVATQGWTARSTLTTDQVVELAGTLGVRRALFTDIGRDGTLEGPNLEALARVVQTASFEVLASGGVASVADVQAVRAVGAAGVILGRALYTGRVDLRAAIQLAGG